MDFIQFEAQTTPYLKYGRRNLLAFATVVAVVNGMNVNGWIRLMIGIMICISLVVDPHVVLETTHLEQG